MAWFEIHQSLSRHRKTLRAVALLGCDRHAFIGHMVELWWWALDNVPSTGDLGTVLDEEIAGAADWTGDAQRFVSILTEAGFIDQDANGRRIHQWEEYGGKLIAKRAANKERMKQARAEHVQRTNHARATFVSAVQESTVQKRTEENIKETTSQEEVVKKGAVSQKPQPPAPSTVEIHVPTWAESLLDIKDLTAEQVQKMVALGEMIPEQDALECALSFSDWWPQNSKGRGKKRTSPVSTFSGFVRNRKPLPPLPAQTNGAGPQERRILRGAYPGGRDMYEGDNGPIFSEQEKAEEEERRKRQKEAQAIREEKARARQAIAPQVD